MQTDFVSLTPGYSDSPGTLDKTMGQNDFLHLLVVQLQNQDPLEPVKNEQFVAQLAQFSSLEQLVNINDSLTGLHMLESSINNSQAVNLIGKKITVSGNSLMVQDGQQARGSFVLDGTADSVTVTVQDESGATVRTLELGSKAAGSHEFLFDGRDDAGTELPDGNYTFTIKALGEDGKELNAATFADVIVEGITFCEGYVYLIAGGQRYMLSEITEVRGI